MVEREYIGDGVYVLYDGNGFWLYANDLEKPTDAIYLEQEVVDVLAVTIRRGNFDFACPETIELHRCHLSHCICQSRVGPMIGTRILYR